MGSTPDYSGMPLPSVWEILGMTAYFLWEFTVRFWPLLALAIGGRLLLHGLERWADRRRLRRHYRDAALEDELLIADYPQQPVAHATYPPDWDRLRRRVYRRANYRCQNCGVGQVELHAHHIVPLSVGGTNALSNLACLCRGCHAAIHPHMRGERPYAVPLIDGAYDPQGYASIPDARLRW